MHIVCYKFTIRACLFLCFRGKARSKLFSTVSHSVRNRNRFAAVIVWLRPLFSFFPSPSSHFCFSNFLLSPLFIQRSHSKIVPRCGPEKLPRPSNGEGAVELLVSLSSSRAVEILKAFRGLLNITDWEKQASEAALSVLWETCTIQRRSGVKRMVPEFLPLSCWARTN